MATLNFSVLAVFVATSLGIATGALAIEFLHPVDDAYQL